MWIAGDDFYFTKKKKSMEMTKEENMVRIFTSRARIEEKNQSALSIIQEKICFHLLSKIRST